MTRNKEVTKQKLIDAVGKIILRDGFSAVGINSVSKEAGVNKVLIYRYFDDLNGLLKAFIIQKDYFSNITAKASEIESSSSVEDIVRLAKKIFTGQLKDISGNRELQEILLWELTTKNDITSAIANERELQGTAILNRITQIINKSEIDIPAVSAIILGGIYYIALRSRHVDVFNGIDLHSNEGWNRIKNTVDDLIGLALDAKK